jgi:ABC-type uncharacterized transport system substrate-binding protein
MKTSLIIFLVLIGVSLGVNCSAMQKKILVIHSYEQELAWTKQCNRGITSVLGDEYSLEYVYLDTKSIPQTLFQGKVDMAMDAFHRFKPDLVMLGDDNALRLLGPQIADTGIPVVYFGINNNPRKYFTTLPGNVTGVMERIPLFPWVRYLLEIVPNAKKVLVLADDSATAEAIIGSTFAGRREIVLGDCTVEYTSTASWPRWQRAVLESAPYGFIIMPIYHALKDDSGAHIPYDKVVTWTSANSPIPVFSNQDYAVADDGVVGSYVLFGEEHGRIVGRMTRDILAGKDIATLRAPGEQQGVFYFNRRQLKRHGLTLPPGILEKTVFR